MVGEQTDRGGLPPMASRRRVAGGIFLRAGLLVEKVIISSKPRYHHAAGAPNSFRWPHGPDSRRLQLSYEVAPTREGLPRRSLLRGG
jgi:hypothetical protein